MNETYEINPEIKDPELIERITIMIRKSDELRKKRSVFGYIMTLEDNMMINMWRDDLQRNAHRYGYTLKWYPNPKQYFAEPVILPHGE